MKNDLVRHEDGHILTHHQPQVIEQDFGMLDTYAGGIVHDETRIDALATISAGYRDSKGMPQRSRDGTIYLHDPEGRAPGLARILEANGGKQLTVAFAFNSISEFIQQRYSAYSRSALLAYGDHTGITEIIKKGSDAEHVLHLPGTPDFDRVLGICKVSVSVYFSLVEWKDNTPVMIWPDGFGQYRLRFTSRNSLRNLMGQLQRLAVFTGGRFAGIPFDLRIVNREVADPNGMKRTIPAWTITMNSPAGLSMDSSTFRQLASAGVEEARKLQLDPPAPETLDMALLDMPDFDMDSPAVVAETATTRPDRVVKNGRIMENLDDIIDVEISEPTERDLKLMMADFDYDTELNRFFAAVDGTPLDDDAARAQVLAREFDGLDSLKEVLASGITAKEWDDFLGRLHFTASEQKQREADRDFTTYSPKLDPKQITWLQDQVERAADAGLNYILRFDFLSWLLDRPISRNTDLTLEDCGVIKDSFYVLNEETNRYRMLPDTSITSLVERFDASRTSDDAFEAALNNSTPARPTVRVGGQDVAPLDYDDTEGIDFDAT